MRLMVIYAIYRRLLNFTYNMFNPADGSWGIVGEDFSWGGLAGHVAYGYRQGGLGSGHHPIYPVIL